MIPGAVGRVLIYLVGTPLVAVVAFSAGHEHFERTECTGPGYGGECDIAGLSGLLWSGAALVLWMGLIVGYELWRWRRQRAARASADATR